MNMWSAIKELYKDIKTKRDPSLDIKLQNTLIAAKEALIAEAVVVSKQKRIAREALLSAATLAREQGKYCLTCNRLSSANPCHDVRLAYLDPKWIQEPASTEEQPDSLSEPL